MAEIPTEQINQMKANLKDHVAELQPLFDALKQRCKHDERRLTQDQLKKIIATYIPLKPYERNSMIDRLLDFEKSTTEIMIPDEDYDKFMMQVMAMPPKKRKNFKSFLTDKCGSKSKVIYDGELKNYCSSTRTFVRVIRASEMEGFKPVSKLGYDIAQGRDMNEAMAEVVAENHTGNHTGRINHHVKIPAPSTW